MVDFYDLEIDQCDQEDIRLQDLGPCPDQFEIWCYVTLHGMLWSA